MFEDLATDLLGGVLACVNTLMLLMLFVPIRDKLQLVLKDVIKSGKEQLVPTKIVKGEWGKRHRAHTIGETVADHGRHSRHNHLGGGTRGVEEAEFEMGFEIHHLPATVRDYASSISDDSRSTAAHRRTTLNEVLHSSLDRPTSSANRFSVEVSEVVVEEADVEEDVDSAFGAESISWDDGHHVAKSLLSMHAPEELGEWINTWREKGRVAKTLKVSYRLRLRLAWLSTAHTIHLNAPDVNTQPAHVVIHNPFKPYQ